MSPRFDREQALALGYAAEVGRLGIVKVRTEQSLPKGVPKVDQHIVFLPASRLERDGALRREAESVKPTGVSAAYRDAGFLDWTEFGSIINISGDPKEVMDVQVPTDISPNTPEAEREDTIDLVQEIAGPQIRVTGS